MTDHESFVPVPDYEPGLCDADECICTACGHVLHDMGRATNQYPTPCPECRVVAVDPRWILVTPQASDWERKLTASRVSRAELTRPATESVPCPVCKVPMGFSYGLDLYYCDTHGRQITAQAQADETEAH